jgi:hypothetical protein
MFSAIKRIVPLVLIAGAMALTSGCAVNRANASLSPGADLSKVRTAYVVKHGNDKYNVNEIIRSKLEKKGYAVTTGTQAAAPAATDISVTYIDKWMWDITMYMVELTIDFRDPKTNFPLATGNSLHTSLTRKSPDAMVDEVLNNILSAPRN